MPESSSPIPASEPIPDDHADVDSNHGAPAVPTTSDAGLTVARERSQQARVRKKKTRKKKTGKKKSRKLTVPLSERAAYSIVEAGAMLGFGPSKSYELAACGAIPTITIVTERKREKGNKETRRVPADLFRRKFGLGEPEAK